MPSSGSPNHGKEAINHVIVRHEQLRELAKEIKKSKYLHTLLVLNIVNIFVKYSKIERYISNKLNGFV